MALDLASLEELARRYTTAWCSQNASSVAAFYSPDGVLVINDGPPAVGRPAITAAAQDFMTAFPDMKVILRELSGQGDCAIYHWRLLGTNNGPGGTGKRVQMNGHEEWRIGCDGLIFESRGHFDAAEYQHQLEHGFEAAQ